MIKSRKAIPGALGLALLVPAVHAQTFTYSTGDLLAAFRQTGAANDLVVDLGAVTTYENAAPGSSFTVSQVTSSQLSATFSALNSLTFSVIGTQGNAGGVGSDPAYTSYLTDPRLNPGTQTTAPNGYSPATSRSISSAISGIAGIGTTTGALVYGPIATYPPSTQSGLLIPTSGVYAANSFGTKFTAVGGLQSLVTAPGVENTTPAAFASTAGATAASDLYAYLPGTAGKTATYLGEFTLNNSGQLTFTAQAVPEPGTMALCALGGLGLLLARQSRSRATLAI